MKLSQPIGPRLAFISTFPPRACGIATFTADLRQAVLATRPGAQASVVALTNRPENYAYPPEVVFEVEQDQPDDYRLAAEYLNLSGVDVVCLQHEFGIFGGAYGRYIIDLLQSLRKPVVTTLHTVLRNPSPGYRGSLIRVAAASDRLVVMNSLAIPILKKVYGIDEAKIRLIHHGVPEAGFVDPNYYKDKFGVEGRTVILTFGLLSRNKGIEVMIDALPEVVRRHPEVVYIILGATHPEVKRQEGEDYRRMLEQRVRDLGLTNHVIFHDRYVEFNTLCEFLGACDIYVTPYRSQEQIVSGTLAYAVGMGRAIISTPYWYAKELLADGRGRLVNFDDSAGLAQTLLTLIENKAARHRMRKRAYKYGQQMLWREVSKQYLDMFEQAIVDYRNKVVTRPARRLVSVGFELPPIKLDHLSRLTDDTGIIQHAAYGVPDRRHGYSTDDVARALVVALMHYHQFNDALSFELATKYLSFLQYAQRPDGRFHNFMNYARRFVDKCGSEDTLGRALWGLGTAVVYGCTDGMRALAVEMFERSLNALQFEHARAMAYAICGLYNFLHRYDGATRVRRKLHELAKQLASLFDRSRSEDWPWFGDEVTYANAKLSQAMLLAFCATGEASFKTIGLTSLEFLLGVTYQDAYFDFIGNQGWLRRNGARAVFGQQTIEAGYTAEACRTAFEVTGQSRYLDMARAAVEWLLGRNRLGACVYDVNTGAFADGLDPQGLSMNQGAESVICGLLALLAAARQSEQRLTSSASALLIRESPSLVNAPDLPPLTTAH